MTFFSPTDVFMLFCVLCLCVDNVFFFSCGIFLSDSNEYDDHGDDDDTSTR